MMDLDNMNKLENLKKSMMVTNTVNNREDKINYVHSNLNKTEVGMKTNYKEQSIDLENLQWGDVLYVNLDQSGVGSEQRGIRYAVVIQNDVGNKYSPTVIVAFITSQITKAKLPLVHVEIKANNFGLPKDSVVLLEQIRTLDKKRIIKRVGRLDEITSIKIEKALQNSTRRKLEKKSSLDRLPKYIQSVIYNKLNSITNIEKTISDVKNENLIKHLLSEREAYLLSLQKICEENNINYKEYYVMYKKEEERFIM